MKFPCTIRQYASGQRPSQSLLLLGLLLMVALVACAPTEAEDTSFKAVKTTNEDFSQPSFLQVGNNPLIIDVADYDVDAILDIAVMSQLNDQNQLSATLSILTGTSTSAPVYTETKHVLGSSAGQIGFADLDGAGGADLFAMIHHRLHPYLWICLDLPTCASPITLDLPGTPQRIEVVDLDGVAPDDLLMTIPGINSLVAFLGPLSGASTEISTETIDPSSNLISAPGNFATGYFDGDGNLDMAVLHILSKQVTIWLGDGAGGFTTSADSQTYPLDFNPISIQARDFTGNGFIDLAISTAYGTTSSTESSRNLTLFTGDGSGAFSAAEVIGIGKNPGKLYPGDFNTTNIGQELILLHNNISTATYLAQAAVPPPSLEGNSYKVTENPFDAATGTFAAANTGLDIAIIGSEERALTILDGDNAGGFIRTTIGFEHSTRFPYTANLDGSGLDDLILIQPTEDRLVFLLNP